MLRRAALVCLLPTLAQAQTAGQVIVTESADGDGYLNLAECQGTTPDNVGIAWQVANGGVPPTSVPASTPVTLTISANDGNCPAGASATVWQPTTAPDANLSASGGYPLTGTLSVTTVLTPLGLNGCAAAQYTLTACASMSVGGTTYSAKGTILFDTRPAPAPTLSSVAPGDSALIVSFTPGTSGSGQGDSNQYQAVASAGGQDYKSTVTTSTNPIHLNGLVNGTTYDVVVYAYSKAGNQSAASNTMSGTPEPVTDFWQAYKAAGGREQGGCGAGPAGEPSALLALLASLLARRRRRP